MQIVLLERVEKLGGMGDVVRVRPGYARNFLLPRGKAMRATPANVEAFEARRQQFEATNLKRREEAEGIAARMNGTVITVLRQAGENGQLYGSVRARDIAEGLRAVGFTVNREQIQLGGAVKAVGLHPLRVALHPEVDATVTVNVATTEEQAARQLDPDGTSSGEPEDLSEAALAAAEAALSFVDDEAADREAE